MATGAMWRKAGSNLRCRSGVKPPILLAASDEDVLGSELSEVTCQERCVQIVTIISNQTGIIFQVIIKRTIYALEQ